VGTDVNERIEVAVNGSDNGVYYLTVSNNDDPGYVYASDDPSVATISAPDENGIKYIVFAINGLGDGPFLSVYLNDSSNIPLERLSFEGATPGFGETAIKVYEDGTGPSNFSLQRRGNIYWYPPRQSNFGAANKEVANPSPVKKTKTAPTPVQKKMSVPNVPTPTTDKFPVAKPSPATVPFPATTPVEEPDLIPSPTIDTVPVESPTSKKQGNSD
jgi:hypothetical protein